ncbi:hypothetical protein GCM10011611_30820 [Aliidongia dinghuensis]|uniref:Uncharacterized protein n=1 Tax=Aliidongia dinghuensis TaxID=1867774 RepID=A0A8J2YVX3_9PROT|nr:hypothetical protein [Aliidongia dinghuensis]GGF22576.1 hypothetical protein GCM10011611_30820 [Aliidongia dinghuensis]
MAHFSSQTIEALVDLVEIKLSYLDVTDREDRLELKRLQHALVELETARRAAVPPRRVPARRATASAAAL